MLGYRKASLGADSIRSNSCFISKQDGENVRQDWVVPATTLQKLKHKKKDQAEY